ncbi:MAG: hypothetical protein LBF89_08650 [Bacteroidales bacterium]|jgi:hypothetical protein|nr:hypothetical protein [Bacteroidales bacterium]
MANINNERIPETVAQQMLAKLNEAYDLIRPYLHTLTTDERVKLLKMGDKSLALAEKTAEFAAVNPELAPKHFDLEELKTDLADVSILRSLHNRAQQIADEIDNTMMLAGHEAYTQSLSFYNSAKQAVHDGVPGAKTVFEELKERFLGRRTSKTSKETAQ